MNISLSDKRLKDLVTIVTMSKEPFTRDDVGECRYVNHVSTFITGIDEIVQRYIALDTVKTPYVFYCDYDDPIPENFTIVDAGMIYGDFNILTNGVNNPIKLKPFDQLNYKQKIRYIHNPFYNTAQLKKLMEITIGHIRLHSSFDLMFQRVIPFLMGYTYNSYYDPSFKAYWDKKDTGRHLELKIYPSLHTWLPQFKDKIKNACLN